MEQALKQIGKPAAAIFSLLMVWFGMALGHSLVVLQHSSLPMGVIDTTLSWSLGLFGFALVWIGMRPRSEAQATILGYLGGNFIWCGIFEWTWRYYAHWLELEPIMADGFMILSPELLLIQATTLLVVAMLIFLGANKDTRCRMFMWFHRNFKLTPARMTPGFKRQHARNAAMETVFLIWTIYLFAIWINDPRGIRYDSVAAMVITVGFVIWSIYLISKLLKIRGLGPIYKYAIATGSISWLPIEAFSRWGLYPEVWIKPQEYSVLMSIVLLLFVGGALGMLSPDKEQKVAAPA